MKMCDLWWWKKGGKYIHVLAFSVITLSETGEVSACYRSDIINRFFRKEVVIERVRVSILHPSGN